MFECRQSQGDSRGRGQQLQRKLAFYDITNGKLVSKLDTFNSFKLEVNLFNEKHPVECIHQGLNNDNDQIDSFLYL